MQRRREACHGIQEILKMALLLKLLYWEVVALTELGEKHTLANEVIKTEILSGVFPNSIFTYRYDYSSSL